MSGWNDFLEVREGRFFFFFFFVTKRLKYDVEGGERGYIFHLSLDIKGRKDFFFFFKRNFRGRREENIEIFHYFILYF